MINCYLRFIVKLLIVVSPLVWGIRFYSYYERSVSGYDVIWCCNPFDLIIHIDYCPTDKLSYWNPINDIFEHNIIPAYLFVQYMKSRWCWQAILLSNYHSLTLYILSLERENYFVLLHVESSLLTLLVSASLKTFCRLLRPALLLIHELFSSVLYTFSLIHILFFPK